MYVIFLYETVGQVTNLSFYMNLKSFMPLNEFEKTTTAKNGKWIHSVMHITKVTKCEPSINVEQQKYL